MPSLLAVTCRPRGWAIYYLTAGRIIRPAFNRNKYPAQLDS